jgi:osmotically-inducible protein OsmY
MQRSKPHAAWAALLLALIASLSLSAGAQTTPTASGTAASSAAVDNTKINDRDRNSQTATPASQPNDKADIKLAAAVRRALMKDKTLSTSAHNVKLVASQGTVTLRGPVKNEDEKSRVESVVKSVAGVNSVDNELDVKH